MKTGSSNMAKVMKELKKSTKYDVNKHVRFQCLIGKTEAIWGMLIEPDPHGDESGTHAHSHMTIICPNIKAVDIPEPDQCQITNKTCPFVTPAGRYQRDPKLRKGGYAHEIIQMMALIEFYGTQLVNKILATKGLPRIQDNLKFVELTRIMVVCGLINKEAFEKIEKLRRIRNKLAHRPKEYLKISEKELFEYSMEAQEVYNEVRKIVEEFNSNVA